MNIIRSYLHNVISEPDRTVAVAALPVFIGLAVYVMASFARPIQLLAPVLGILACSGYLLIRRRLSPSTIDSLTGLRASASFYKLLNVLFFLILSYGMLSIYLSPEPYNRPLGYFISVALMAAILAVEILFFADSKRRIYLILVKIILIALSLVWSQLLIFPSVLGVDPWWHQAFTVEIASTGHLPEAGQYSRMPLTHLVTAVTMILTDLEYKMSAMFSISLFHTVSNILFTFLLGRLLFNTKTGLLAALLMGVSTYYVRFGIWAIPNTLAATFLLPIIYLLFKIKPVRPVAGTSLVLILMAALILTHSIVAMSLAILLVIFWAAFQVRGILYGENPTAPVTISITILFVVAMFSYWLYISGHIYSLARMIGEGFQRETPLYVQAGQMASPVTLGEQFLSEVGPVLFLALSLVGCFYMLSKRFGSGHSFAIALGGMVLLCLVYLPPLASLSIIEGRWAYLSTIMLAIPVGLGLLMYTGVINSVFGKGAVLAIAVFALSFLMVISPRSNLDNRRLTPNVMVRLAFTESELRAAQTISDMRPEVVASDGYYARAFHSPEVNNQRFVAIDPSLKERDFSGPRSSVVLIREEIVSQPFYLSGSLSRLDYDPREVLGEQGFSMIYDSGSVAGFINLESGSD